MDQLLSATNLHYALCDLLNSIGDSDPQPSIDPVNIFRHCEDEFPLYNFPNKFPGTSSGQPLCLEETINYFIDKIGQEGILLLREDFRAESQTLLYAAGVEAIEYEDVFMDTKVEKQPTLRIG